jgi:hypothetical protein
MDRRLRAGTVFLVRAQANDRQTGNTKLRLASVAFDLRHNDGGFGNSLQRPVLWR